VSVIEDLQGAAGRVVDRAAASVVRVGRGPGRGAGVVVANGVVVTNAHNVRGREVTITFASGRQVVGDVKGIDPDGDLAVVAVDTADTSPLEWSADEHGPRVGTPVWTVVNIPGGGVRVTVGTISGAGRAFRSPTGRLISEGIEHTALLGRGSSGSPVLDGDGRLLAINTHRLGDGFYLAIPATATLRERVESLGRGEEPVHVRLGVALAPTHAARRMRAAVGLPERDGLLVRGVEEGSAADRAGIQRGDLIVAGEGQPLTTADALFALLDGLAPGGALSLQIVRGTDEIAVRVDFGGTTASEGSA
jgi:S1-C subfamily serine protease